MKIIVELYGGLRQRVGSKRIEVEIDSDRVVMSDVVEAVEVQVPDLAGKLGGVACAVNDEIVGATYQLKIGEVVALLPPVSGGSGENIKYLSAAPLDQAALVEETIDARCGALVVFSGDIRNHNAGRADVVAIEYEAHEAIAARVLEEIEQEVVEKFEVHRCRIQHRVGRVEVGESSVLVVCRAAHRGAAFEGARYGIDELKERVPLWKHEHYEDGTSKYLDGVELKG